MHAGCDGPRRHRYHAPAPRPRRASGNRPQEASQRPHGDRRRVLIVEDDRGTRTALRSHFRSQGWLVAEAATVAEGFDLLDPPPDCLVLDLMLTDGDGEEILRKVREDGLPTRVVAVTTGSNDAARLAVVKGLDPDVLLCKPIDPNVLIRLCEAEMEGALGACPDRAGPRARSTTRMRD
jgi:DNA-binding response OmpR family regulator